MGTTFRQNGRGAWAVAAALMAAATVGGCVQRQELADGRFDRWWRTGPDPWASAVARPIRVEGFTIPTEVTLVEDPNVAVSTLSLVRSANRLMRQGGAESVRLRICPAFTEAMADELARAREQLAALDRLGVGDGSGEWARRSAEALWTADRLMQLAAAPGARGGARRRLAVSAGLNVSFVMAGRELPAGLVARVASLLRRDAPGDAGAGEPGAARGQLADLLAEAMARAPRRPVSEALSDAAGRFRRWWPIVLGALESFLRQWPSVRSLTVAYRESGGRPIVALTLRVREGRRVRLAHLAPGMGAVELRGAVRMSVQAGEGEAVVRLTGVEGGGGALVHLDEAAGGLGRLVADMGDAWVEQVRIDGGRWRAGGRLVNVVMQMTSADASPSGTDGRRVLAYQAVERWRVRRGATSVRRVQTLRRQSVAYATPHTCVVYRRSRGPAPSGR